MTFDNDYRPIAVGVDGSPDGLRAVEFAAKEAHASGHEVRLIHAYHVTAGLNPMLPLYGVEGMRENGVNALRAAQRRLQAVAPEVKVEHLLVASSPAAALVEASTTATLVVVGRRALHGLGRLLSGSTTTTVTARSRCPVVSVPVSWPGTQTVDRVVVGVDGSANGRAALAYAFGAASRRGASLTAVRAWDVPSRWYPDHYDVERHATDWLARVRLALAEDLAGWSERFPDVAVERAFERSSSPAEALVRRSQGASIVVVGARGLGGVPGLDLGWTARGVLAHATCPAVVVHDDPSRHQELAPRTGAGFASVT